VTVPLLFVEADAPDPQEWDPSEILFEAPPWVPGWPITVAPDASASSRVQLAVSTIREFAWLGELIGADVESWSESLDGYGGCGGGEVRFSTPTTDESALDTLLVDEEDWGAFGPTGEPRLIDRAVHVVVDGQVTAPYVLRSEAQIDAQRGLVTFTGQAPGRLVADRVIGTGAPADLLEGRGFFPGSGSLASLGWTWEGDPGDIRWTTGVRSGRAVEIRGDPLTSRLTIRKVVTPGQGETQHVQIFTGAQFRLPNLDPNVANNSTLVSVSVHHSSDLSRFWPPPGQGNEGDSDLSEDMPRGVWLDSPLVAWAVTPLPPYSVIVEASFYPVTSATEWTAIDEVTMFRRDTLGLGAPRDLCRHVSLLLEDAQHGPGKTSFSLPVVITSETGTVENGHWRRDSMQPHQDAIAALTSRRDGPDPPWVRPDWRFEVAARRGAVRDDLVLGPDDIVGAPSWSHDAGSQASRAIVETDRGWDWLRVSSVQTDTTLTDGHVIERVQRAPGGITLKAVDEWAKAELASVSQPQNTMRVLVAWELGASISVGDSFRVANVSGFWRMHDWMRCWQRTFLPRQRLVALDLGSDLEAV
jgi:hypothetical protein